VRTQANPRRSRAGKAIAARVRTRVTLARDLYPCLWCGGAIPVDRVKNAIARKESPKFCSDLCRAGDPSRSLANRIYFVSMGISVDDPKKWRAEYEARLAVVLSPVTPAAKRAAK